MNPRLPGTGLLCWGGLGRCKEVSLILLGTTRRVRSKMGRLVGVPSPSGGYTVYLFDSGPTGRCTGHGGGAGVSVSQATRSRPSTSRPASTASLSSTPPVVSTGKRRVRRLPPRSSPRPTPCHSSGPSGAVRPTRGSEPSRGTRRTSRTTRGWSPAPPAPESSSRPPLRLRLRTV